MLVVLKAFDPADGEDVEPRKMKNTWEYNTLRTRVYRKVSTRKPLRFEDTSQRFVEYEFIVPDP